MPSKHRKLNLNSLGVLSIGVGGVGKPMLAEPVSRHSGEVAKTEAFTDGIHKRRIRKISDGILFFYHQYYVGP